MRFAKLSASWPRTSIGSCSAGASPSTLCRRTQYVDALVVVNDHDASPDTLLTRFKAALDSRLSGSDVLEISTGALAVTITYQDGSQIQLLPAVERDGRTSIASEDGSAWRQIRPHKFAEKLTEVNRANGQAVVPTIKLAKSVLRNLPEPSSWADTTSRPSQSMRSVDTVAGATAPRWSFTWYDTPSEPFSGRQEISRGRPSILTRT